MLGDCMILGLHLYSKEGFSFDKCFLGRYEIGVFFLKSLIFMLRLKAVFMNWVYFDGRALSSPKTPYQVKWDKIPFEARRKGSLLGKPGTL